MPALGLTALETRAVVAATDVALLPAERGRAVTLGSPVSQPVSFLSVHPLKTPVVPRRTGHGVAQQSNKASARPMRPRSVQDLCFAAHRGDTATIEALLDRPVRLDDGGELEEYGVAAVQVNESNARGLTALHWAVAGGRHAAVALLLKRNADVDLKDRSVRAGRTALHYAADCLMLELLLQAGATHEAEDVAGRTAAQYHAERKRPELSDFVSPSNQRSAVVVLRTRALC